MPLSYVAGSAIGAVAALAVSTSVDDLDSDRTRTIGTPLPHVEVKVADAEHGHPLPIGEAGELCLRGNQVMDGYLDLPEASVDAIDSDGWLHTGDLAAMDARGYAVRSSIADAHTVSSDSIDDQVPFLSGQTWQVVRRYS